MVLVREVGDDRPVPSTGPRSGERGVRGELYRGVCGRGPSTGPRSGERGVLRSGVRIRGADVPSTGPRSGERGVLASQHWVHSVIFLQRGRAPESAEWPRPTPGWSSSRAFNGAALRRARSARGDMVNGSVAALQRGRAPESAECSILSMALADLGILQRGRAPESAECWRQRRLCDPAAAFNGAALRRARSGRRRRPAQQAQRAPSTGPRSGERGVSDFTTQIITAANLQRGRAPESAEWPGTAAHAGGRLSPSTGPRSGERGVQRCPRR